jgi:2-oxo-3-(phosphooxy)propyl 3-oxoalkanoate synthase
MTAMVHGKAPELSGELPSGDSQLFRRGVSTDLVRRTHEADVFVTNLRVTGPSRFEVRAQWPGSHSFYGPTKPDTHDSMLYLESVRQAVLLIGQYAYQIPRKHKFITHDKRFEIDPAGLRANGDEPVDITMTITVHDIAHRSKRVAGMRMEYLVDRDGERIGTAGYRVSIATDAVYARVRGDRIAAHPACLGGIGPVDPKLVGRTESIDVMLNEVPDSDGWALRVDPGHPVVYDHVIDHVPGNGAIEAARQAALLTVGDPRAVVVGCDFAFAHYIEFDQICMVYAEETNVGTDDSRTVRVWFEQDGRTSAEGTLELLTVEPFLPLGNGAEGTDRSVCTRVPLEADCGGQYATGE